MRGRSRGDPERTVEYFDSVAGDYASLYRQRTPGSLAFRIRKERVLELFDQPGGAVLDVGCGPGVIVEELLARGCRFAGIDPSVRMIDQAKARFASLEKVSFSVGAAERIEYPDDSFDAVVCMGVLERVEDPSRALAEMVRVVKPNGTLLLTVPNRMSPYFLWRDFVFYPVVALARWLYFSVRGQPRPLAIPDHELFTAPAIVREVQGQGCEVIQVAYTGFNPILPPLESLLPGLAVLSMEKLEALRATPLRVLGGGIVVKARKREETAETERT